MVRSDGAGSISSLPLTRRIVISSLLGTAACFSPPAGESGTEGTTTIAGSGSESGSEASTGPGATSIDDADGSSGAEDTAADGSSGGTTCGDGSIDDGEECDLGPSNSDNAACTSDCRLAVCGDGLLFLGREECDDGGPSARCDADCTAAECGDGTVNPTAGEQCEADGPNFVCDACQAVCNDGFGECNGDVEGDGCEADLSSPLTCGGCSTACGMGEECIDQACVEIANRFLLSERNASTIWEWDPMAGSILVYHQVQANDADCNSAEGSPGGWVVEHFGDSLSRFVPGSGMGTDLNVGVTYAYPKHVTVFDGQVVVMSRNDATLVRYEPAAGMVLGSVPSGNGVGQGMATDGVSLWASFWNGGGNESFFVRYDAAFVPQETIPSPAGIGVNVNVFDIAYHPPTGHFFGLATGGEQGTGTESSTVYEFQMGGAVVDTHAIPFLADGIGQSACN